MQKQFLTLLKDNLSRLIVGALISLFTMLCTWAMAPVKELISIPKTLTEMQAQIEKRQDCFIETLEKQRETDSILFEQVATLQASTQTMHTEIGTIKSKVNAIREEFPILHKRFNDIEEAVGNTRNLAFIPFNNNNLSTFQALRK